MPIDAIIPTWVNAATGAPAYDSESLRRDLSFLLAGGATPDVSRSGVLDTRALTVALSGSNVQVSAGGAAVGSGKGAYLTGASSTLTVDTLTPADTTNPRRDRVVLEVLDPDNGGGSGRKAQFRVIAGTPSATAASGGGYPPAPTSPSLTLAYIDVPVTGSPSVTDQRPYTAAAGAAIPARDATDRGTITAFVGRRIIRLDAGGVEERYDGANWVRNGGPHAMAAGAAAIGIVTAGSTTTALAQAFPAGRFSQPPIVTVTTDQSRVIAVAANVTTTGFNLYMQNVTSGDSANGSMRWTAVQMTPTSAAG